ncbi:hypothetical protein [Alkaliphilus sp. B6464]|uniref:hypothetical protein n=1 Tax=Alkaliphilus sp. B6464 TaxID=2731219 RepID=UPI001BA5E283|nr:hypothetical protein [Alkaliphilus sp. B6464]QUH21869.1 hypothetical protein HYG84_18200 [Alkaliphilus sp. B6464]
MKILLSFTRILEYNENLSKETNRIAQTLKDKSGMKVDSKSIYFIQEWNDFLDSLSNQIIDGFGKTCYDWVYS